MHEEEEFLYVATGSGVWTVGEDVFPAKAGVLLYPVPHDLHGVTNTGTENLSFYFFKWNNRGVAPPEAGNVEQAMDAMVTQVISREDAEHISDVWGELYLYTNGAKTFGMENVTTGIAELLPGMEIHPPHVHVEEEFLYIVSGSGT